MRFTIKNAGDKTAELDTVSFDNVYYASVNGGNRVKETLFVWSTKPFLRFSGKIKAGEQETAMLLFSNPGGDSKGYQNSGFNGTIGRYNIFRSVIIKTS